MNPSRVLVIDMEERARDEVGSALTRLGFAVSTAASGRGGIDRFLADGADVVVCALDLAGMDGLATCRALKTLAAGAFLPVILVAPRAASVETMTAVLDEGADDVVLAPCPIGVLAARVRVAARTRRREEKLESETRILRVAALLDPLTGLGNRRAFDGDLEREWARMRRSERSLALLLLDVDRFKQVNDRYGHRAGDRILLGVAQAIAAEVRASDSASRFGGDEFAILAPDAGADGAAILAERIRLRIATLGGAGTAVVTASVGVAFTPSAGIDSTEQLVKAADDALYAAKREGRNRVSRALVA